MDAVPGDSPCIQKNKNQKKLRSFFLCISHYILILGIVCQSPLFQNNPGLLQLTPGVQIDSKGDNLGQQYNTPDHIVLELGADIAVVGRGITQAADPRIMAMKYQDELWKAYLKRTQSS